MLDQGSDLLTLHFTALPDQNKSRVDEVNVEAQVLIPGMQVSTLKSKVNRTSICNFRSAALPTPESCAEPSASPCRFRSTGALTGSIWLIAGSKTRSGSRPFTPNLQLQEANMRKVHASCCLVDRHVTTRMSDHRELPIGHDATLGRTGPDSSRLFSSDLSLSRARGEHH